VLDSRDPIGITTRRGWLVEEELGAERLNPDIVACALDGDLVVTKSFCLCKKKLEQCSAVSFVPLSELDSCNDQRVRRPRVAFDRARYQPEIEANFSPSRIDGSVHTAMSKPSPVVESVA
jgi:hypothetical protein